MPDPNNRRRAVHARARGARLSEHYRLGAAQPSLDFLDVTVGGDDALFIDPQSLRELPGAWAQECVALIQDFFDRVLELIRSGQTFKARQLLAQLSEPNETHLGLSQGTARGHGMGKGLARQLAAALSASEAVKTGLLGDLEETVLMIEGVSHDLISDIATNVIRQPLIRFTQQQAGWYGIPMHRQWSGPMWDPATETWVDDLVDLPRVGGRRLLLVPKVIVRTRPHYRPDEYFNDYVLGLLAKHEIENPNSSLVHLLKDGTPRVTKKALKGRYGKGKAVSAEITLKEPAILDEYRAAKGRSRPRPLTHQEFADAMPGVVVPDYGALVASIRSLPAGRADADKFHRAVEALLTAVLHPALTMPAREVRIHGGRKRVDLAYLNQAHGGFFEWLSRHYSAPTVWVECKNYDEDPANPELDQLTGRFSPTRGQFGLLVCRAVANRDRMVERCRDAALDGRGYVIVLADEDLQALADARAADDQAAYRKLWQGWFDQLAH
jgi:hypothetical protein